MSRCEASQHEGSIPSWSTGLEARMMTLFALSALGAVIVFVFVRIVRKLRNRSKSGDKLFPKHMYDDSVYH